MYYVGLLYYSNIFSHIPICGGLRETLGYLDNAAGPVPLVLDLRIAHDRVGSSTAKTNPVYGRRVIPDHTLNGHLKYPHNLDQSLIRRIPICGGLRETLEKQLDG
jgi:hypothetical protein